MRLLALSLGTIGAIATGVGNALSVVSVFALPHLSKKDTRKNVHNNTSYDDVIMAITQSGMLSSDKTTVVALIPKHSRSTLYKAMINVIESDMLMSDKIETIQHICKN